MPHDQIAVTRSSMPSIEELIAEIEPLWESRWLTNMGEKHQELEKALRERCGVDEVCLFINGHAALECAFEVLGLGSDSRRQVITTPFTFASTTHAISRTGLEPVFADIKPDDYTIDPAQIEAAITEETCAIVPVHVYGNLCDVDAIADIAQRHHLKVVYDAAHAFGVERAGIPCACYGDLSMFSFHATKVFNTIEGGALCFSDPALKMKIDQWKNFGIVDPETIAYIGTNLKMNEFCAAMGLCNLRHLDEEIEKRKRATERYWDNLSGIAGIKLSMPPADIKSNYAYMPVLFENDFPVSRDEVFVALAEEGIGARKYFYPLISDLACYRDHHDSSSTPIARDVSSRILTLPLFADLSLTDVDRICCVIAKLGRIGRRR